ncbi:hypothetical protein [Streptomyces albogriseolus]|uniref:hypothetical protein n=1 Tax=Streptomyces albogriseolus TaxID=1887 RepID=UPI00378AEDE7
MQNATSSEVPFAGSRAEMWATSDVYDVGQMVTVIEDPEADLLPQTPGHVDATGRFSAPWDLRSPALGSVVWRAWRGRVTERETSKTVGTARLQQEQKEKLQEVSRVYPADRRGYIKVSPGEYPALTHARATRIAWEEGLRAEAAGNQGT